MSAAETGNEYLAAWERMVPYAERFSLPFGQMKTRLRGGALKSAAAGGSTEFYDHRHYVPGDDIRHINWAATARSEMITLKQFQQEASPQVNVYLDASESMRYDAGKWARTLDLLALCGLSAAQAEVRVQAYVCKGGMLERFSLTRPQEDLWLKGISEEKGEGFTPPKSTGMPSLHIYLTDLLYEVDPKAWVSAHCRTQDRNLILSPCCKAETDPEWGSQSLLIDPESKLREDYKVDESFWKAYHESYQRHFSLWRHALGGVNGVLAAVPAECDFYEAALREAVPNGLLVL